MKIKGLIAALGLSLGLMSAAQATVDASLPDYSKTTGVSGNLSSVGSDTLNNLMTFWAEAFKKQYPNVNIQIQGAGSSTAPPALTQGTANLGPMSRTMRDVTLIFEALNGPDANDPAGVPLSYRARSLDELRAQPIGYFEDDGLVPVTQETRAAVRAAVEVLRQAGFRVEPFRPQQLEPLRKLWWTFFVQCGEMFYRPTYSGHQAQLSPIFREFLTIAQAEPEMSSMQLLIAWANLDLVRARMLEEMQQFPVLLCPVASVPAWRHGERTWNIDGREVHYLDAVRHTQWFNALGSPAAMVPVGNSPDGLPIGVQIAARPYEDEVALGIASIVDEAFGYRVPPMAQL